MTRKLPIRACLSGPAAGVLGVAPLGLKPQAIQHVPDAAVQTAIQKGLLHVGPVIEHALVVDYKYVAITNHLDILESGSSKIACDCARAADRVKRRSASGSG
jgi:hypothetical protein